MERSFEFARLMKDGKPVIDGNGKELLAYPEAQLPEYQTLYSAGADFFCAEEVTVPSIWYGVFHVFSEWLGYVVKNMGKASEGKTFSEDTKEKINKSLSPTLVHTGIKSYMGEDEVLELYNRSSNPKKLGLILANSVGVVDSDYYNNEGNDGEIMFAYFNFKPWSVTLKVGDRIGQGVFKKFLRPDVGLRVKNAVRREGFGSTNN